MSFFGRKEIARLKKELETSDLQVKVLQSDNTRLEEKCNRYFSALNISEKEAKNYKRKYAELLANVPEFTIPGQISMDTKNEEIAQLKEKCANYEQKLYHYSSTLTRTEKEVKLYKQKYEELLLSNAGCKSSSKTKSSFYKLQDNVRDNPRFMAALYSSKKDFFSPNEFKMYNLLENMLYDCCDEFGDLAVFSQTRLADIVGLHEETYIGENSFCKKAEKYTYKKEVCELIDKFIPDFNDEDYKEAFLYPLFRSHIDFLICDHNDKMSKPILAIELHGTEHDERSKNPDWNRIKNDYFKEALFSPQNNAMKIRLLTVKNQELNDEEKLRNKIYTEIKLCLDCENIIEFVKGKKWNNIIYNDPKRTYVNKNKEPVLLTDEQADVLESTGATLSKSKGNTKRYEFKGVRYAELGEKPAKSSPLNNIFADKLMIELDKAGILYQAQCAVQSTVIFVKAVDKSKFEIIRKDLVNRLNPKDKQTQT